MNRPRILIAGTGSGVGKTTLTLGLMKALKEKGLVVQGYKAGPDFIDPSFHTLVTGRPSRNLDSWMLDPTTLQDIVYRGSNGADISIIEGMMGLFDGKNWTGLQGSTAEISQIIEAPVILVLSAENMARSAAAVVLGFQQMESNVKIAGVIVNSVGSEAHYNLLKAAIEERCHIPVIGYLKSEVEIKLSERHLGLIPAWEDHDHWKRIDKLGKLVTETIDLDKILEIASHAHDLKKNNPSIFSVSPPPSRVPIAVARDSAFNFYYPENLELLELYGAELIEFSPLKGEPIPEEAKGLYLGGGFPEEFAEQLSDHKNMLNTIKERIQMGLPTFAECGGYMLLAESLIDQNGIQHQMAGVIPATVHMQHRLTALGYSEVSGYSDSPILGLGEKARGQEFHYSKMDFHGGVTPAYQVENRDPHVHEGFANKNLIAGYTHLHFGSNPNIAKRFVQTCRSDLNS